MSEFKSILDGLVPENTNKEIKIDDIPLERNVSFDPTTDGLNFGEKGNPFDISDFAKELKTISEDQNKKYFEASSNINGYSIAHDCLACTVKKILGHPVKSFAHKWLPILMRSTIGSAIHEFIQNNTNQFTEIEKSIKVPSIRFSGRIDALIGSNVLVEIKSCTYSDYKKIIKNVQPRTADFLQAMTYKYILENHLNEAKNPGVKTRTEPPRLDKYDIDKIQFIYIAHDICAADIEDFGEALKLMKAFKKQLGVSVNNFPFMTSIVLDTSKFDVTPYNDWITSKIEAINYYVNANKMPEPENRFIDSKKCYYCLYKNQCEYEASGK